MLFKLPTEIVKLKLCDWFSDEVVLQSAEDYRRFVFIGGKCVLEICYPASERSVDSKGRSTTTLHYTPNAGVELVTRCMEAVVWDEIALHGRKLKKRESLAYDADACEVVKYYDVLEQERIALSDKAKIVIASRLLPRVDAWFNASKTKILTADYCPTNLSNMNAIFSQLGVTRTTLSTYMMSGRTDSQQLHMEGYTENYRVRGLIACLYHAKGSKQ